MSLQSRHHCAMSAEHVTTVLCQQNMSPLCYVSITRHHCAMSAEHVTTVLCQQNMSPLCYVSQHVTTVLCQPTSHHRALCPSVSLERLSWQTWSYSVHTRTTSPWCGSVCAAARDSARRKYAGTLGTHGTLEHRQTDMYFIKNCKKYIIPIHV